MRFGHLSTLLVLSVSSLFGQVLFPPDHPSVSVANLNFGMQAVGTTSPHQTVTLSHPTDRYVPYSPNDFIDIIAIGLSDSANFSISGGTCPAVSSDGSISQGYRLAFGHSCTIEIEYRPSSAGLTEASLEIYSNQGASDPYTLWPGGIIPKARWVKTTIQLKGSAQLTKTVPGDFDGDGKRDHVVWRQFLRISTAMGRQISPSGGRTTASGTLFQARIH